MYVHCDDDNNNNNNTVDNEQQRPLANYDERGSEWRHLANHIEKTTSRGVDADDVLVKQAERGVFFTPTNQFKVDPAPSVTSLVDTSSHMAKLSVMLCSVEITHVSLLC